MRIFALLLMLGFSSAASAGYKEAGEAIKGFDDPAVVKELRVLAAGQASKLAADARILPMLSGNQPALQLFRQAAQETNDGYLFAPREDHPTPNTPTPVFKPHIILFRLLMIDAKLKAAASQSALFEADMLVLAKFLAQLSAQKSSKTLPAMVEQLCLAEAYQLFTASIRNPSASPAYLKQLSAALGTEFGNRDHMRTAVEQHAEASKYAVHEKLSPEAIKEEYSKLPFWKVYTVKRIMHDEDYASVAQEYDTLINSRTRLLIGSFRFNDPAPSEAFIQKLYADLKAREQARGKSGFFSEFLDGLKGGPETKKKMKEVLLDTYAGMTMPAFEKLIPRYHLFLCQLSILRAGLAVKLYQRARRRLPDTLAQLVPAYLSEVPQDSFNKFAPLNYAKLGKRSLIYSFGPDKKDDGGRTALDGAAYFDDASKDAGDIVFYN